jgi:SHS family lactate transporter-like MFS transporter
VAFFVERKVDESPAWLERKANKGAKVARPPLMASLLGYLPTFLFVIVLMTAFTSFSHGTQDIYPTFLEKGLGYSAGLVGLLGIIYNVGSLMGGFVFGTLSEKWGRKRAIITAALLAIPIAPLFAYGHTPLMLGIGAFLMQFMVQGAWGVIPVHLNEMSPPAVRAIFPGLAYQLGNVLSSRNNVLQAAAAKTYFGGNFAPVLAITVVVVAMIVALVTSIGKEAKGADLSAV